MITDPRPKIGLGFSPGHPPERLRPLAQLAERAEIDELWIAEDCFAESGIASAAIALGATETLTVGLGFLPTPLRNVALTAMEIATLTRVFPGRVLPGIGHGVQVWMEQTGGRVASPLTLLREYASTLRSLLDGEEVTVAGRYVTLDRVKLAWPPESRVPLLVGGAGPKSLALTGELGDGTLLPAPLSTHEVGDATKIVRVTAGAGDHQIVTALSVATGSDAQQRLAAESRRGGRAPEPELGVAGDAATIAERIRALGAVGSTTVVIVPTQDEPDLDGFIRFLGREVKPLLAGH